MAKLNVVVPAVDVTIDGMVYTKVGREAAVGDVLRMPGRYSFITDGGFYEVTRIDGAGDPQIIDDDGDEYDTCSDDFEVYAKVKPQDGEITHEGRRYRKVARKANVGDFVLGRDDGCIYEVVADVVTDGGKLSVGHVNSRGLSVLESVDPRSQFAVGDKVRLISGGGCIPLNGYDDGAIYTVKDTKRLSERIEISGGRIPNGYAKPEQLAKVTAEDLKWDAIGRKVGEFKAGDIVEVIESGSSNYRVGLIDTVTDDRGLFGTSQRLSSGIDGKNPYILPQRLKLVTPVEQRFDR